MPLLFMWCRQPDSIFILLPVEQNKGLAPSSRRQQCSSAPHLVGFESILFHIMYKSTPTGCSCTLVPATGLEPVRILLRGILSYHSYVEGNGMYIHVKESKSCVESTVF